MTTLGQKLNNVVAKLEYAGVTLLGPADIDPTRSAKNDTSSRLQGTGEGYEVRQGAKGESYIVRK